MARNLKPFFAVSVLMLMLALMAFGQSGRKQKKQDPLPPVQGVNQPDKRVQPEPEIVPEKPKETEQRVIMVMTSLPEMGIPLYYADSARQGFIEEARQISKTINTREASNQNRSDAIKLAKEDKSTYVVFMEIQIDQMGNAAGGFDLRYTVYEPKTGKVVGSGSGYPSRPNSPLPGGRPPLESSGAYYADWAGRDVARQVMKKLGLTF